MRVEFQGGPADGTQVDAPEDCTEITLTDVGPARRGSDPFEGKSLGKMTYRLTNLKSETGAVIFEFVSNSIDTNT
jgi:hypothetical protein